MARINISVALQPETMKLINETNMKESLSKFIDDTVVMRLADEQFQEKMALKDFNKAQTVLETFGYHVTLEK